MGRREIQMTDTSIEDVVQAVQDLTRVVLASSGFVSRADAIRKLHEAAIPPARIARLLVVPVTSVTSTLTKAKKKNEVELAAAATEITGGENG
jgi:hypothetical protein